MPRKVWGHKFSSPPPKVYVTDGICKLAAQIDPLDLSAVAEAVSCEADIPSYDGGSGTCRIFDVSEVPGRKTNSSTVCRNFFLSSTDGIVLAFRLAVCTAFPPPVQQITDRIGNYMF